MPRSTQDAAHHVAMHIREPEIASRSLALFQEGYAVARAVVCMASLPLEANVLSMTVMASGMPLVSRGERANQTLSGSGTS